MDNRKERQRDRHFKCGIEGERTNRLEKRQTIENKEHINITEGKIEGKEDKTRFQSLKEKIEELAMDREERRRLNRKLSMALK